MKQTLNGEGDERGKGREGVGEGEARGRGRQSGDEWRGTSKRSSLRLLYLRLQRVNLYVLLIELFHVFGDYQYVFFSMRGLLLVGLREFSKAMQTLGCVWGLHSYPEFSRRSECLDGAM